MDEHNDVLAPGEHPAPPQTMEQLTIEALRTANRMSGLLNAITAELHGLLAEQPDMDGDPHVDAIHELLLRRFSDCTALHLFIAAGHLGIELPPDLRGGDDETQEPT